MSVFTARSITPNGSARREVLYIPVSPHKMQSDRPLLKPGMRIGISGCVSAKIKLVCLRPHEHQMKTEVMILEGLTSIRTCNETSAASN